MKLSEMASLARSDLYEGRQGAAVDWMVHYAQARAQAALADRRLKRMEDAQRDIRLRMVVNNPDALPALEGAAAKFHGAPSPDDIAVAEAAFEAATELVVAAESILHVLTSRFGAATKRPATSAQVARFGAIQGGKT